MRYKLTLHTLSVALVIAVSVVPPATAQDNTKGRLGKKVVAALKSVAEGTCPEALMGPLLLDQCEAQLDTMKERLSSLGEITGAEYKGVETLPNGIEAEAYRVRFAKGKMMWLSAVGPNGKLVVLWSPG